MSKFVILDLTFDLFVYETETITELNLPQNFTELILQSTHCALVGFERSSLQWKAIKYI